MTRTRTIRFLTLWGLMISMLGMCLSACSDEVIITNETSTDNIVWNAQEGELLIKFAPGMEEVLDTWTSQDGTIVTRSALPPVARIYDILGQFQLKRVFPVDQSNEERTRKSGLHLWYRVSFDEKLDLKNAINELKLLGEVQKVQTNRVLTYSHRPRPIPLTGEAIAQAMQQSSTRTANGPFNDPQLYRQWGYINRGGQSFSREGAPSIAGCDLNCEEAWQYCTGDPSIIVAVLDEGVMYTHPDLADNMWINEGEELKAGRDADGNGYVDDRYGYNFVTDCAILNPYGRNNTGHGSHVAGTIAATNNNGIGCCGIAGGDGSGNGVKIMSCQIIDGNNSVTLFNEARAMKYAADNGAVIMQCSWGYNSSFADQLMGYTPGPATEEEWASLYPLEKEAIDYFIDNAGSPDGVIDGGIVVFASGNEAAGNPAFPSAYSRCVCVSSIAADYTPSTFSNYGKEVDFSAPGGDSDYYGIPGVDDDEVDISDPLIEKGMILSTIVQEEQPGYGYFEGTSMACPAVSGVFALGLSYAKQLRLHYTAEEFKRLLTVTSRDLDEYFTGIKHYHYYHTMAGTTARQMNLADWRGKMGLLPDAGALLQAVAQGGTPMRVPNILVTMAGERNISLSDYYEPSQLLSTSVKVEDTTIATATIQGTTLRVQGVKAGITKATLQIGSQSLTLTITVRESIGHGWL